jgi:apolipoprotein D and lipocalin family protein
MRTNVPQVMKLTKVAILSTLATISILGFQKTARASNAKAPLETVAFVDLERYLGKWYEIARYPAFFQRNCDAATATYSRRDDGLIGVLNECRRKDDESKFDRIEGKAWVVDTATNAKLKVRFFWPFSGDYWVIQLGKSYDYAVVSEPSRKYLWILSRTPKLEQTVLDRILSRLQTDGFDTEKLVWGKHPVEENSPEFK